MGLGDSPRYCSPGGVMLDIGTLNTGGSATCDPGLCCTCLGLTGGGGVEGTAIALTVSVVGGV